MSFGKNRSSGGTRFDPELKQRLLDTFETGRTLSQTPYNPYMRARVSPFSPYELEGMNRGIRAARAAQGRRAMQSAANQSYAEMQRSNPELITVTDVETAASSPTAASYTGPTDSQYTATSLSNTDLSPYQNTYEDAVVKSALGDIEEARQLQQTADAASATRAGAFGGSRDALVRAETNRRALEQSAKTASDLRRSGFESSALRAEADAARAQQMGMAKYEGALRGAQGGLDASMANLHGGIATRAQDYARQQTNKDRAYRAALAKQQAGLDASRARLAASQQFGGQATNVRGMQMEDARAIQAYGQQQRDLAQQQMDDDYRRHIEQQEYPFRMLDVLRGSAGLLPSPSMQYQKGRSFNFSTGG